jgi:hypothetical protein
MKSRKAFRLGTLALVAALAVAGALVWPRPVEARLIRVDGHEPREPTPPGDSSSAGAGGDRRHTWPDSHAWRPGPRGRHEPSPWRHEPPRWQRHRGWGPSPYPGWWPARPAPVWIPGHWEWTGWGWAWVPGQWR